MDTHKEIRFDKMFKFMVNCMWMNKTHPNIPRNLKWFCQFCIWYGLFMMTYLLILYCVIFHDLKKGDAIQTCTNGLLIVIFNVTTLNHVVLGWYRTGFKDLMNQLQIDYDRAKHLPTEEYNIVLAYAKNGRKVDYIWLTVAVCTTVIYQLKAIVTMIYKLTITGKFQFVNLVDITYPENLELKKNYLPVYVSLYVLFTYYNLYAATMYVAMSALGPILILHGCGQLDLVKRRIANTYSKSDKGFQVQNLKLAAKHLTETNNFLRKTNECCRVYHEIIFKAVIGALPILFYQFIETAKKGHFSVELLSLILGSTILCNISCYCSDLLLQKSEEIKLCLYSCGWENHAEKDPHVLILLLMIRVSRPVEMRTMYQSICINALTDIYRQAYGLFNLLHAIWH